MGSNFTNSALESLDTGHFDAQTAAANALGAYIGNLYQDQNVRAAIKNYRQQRQEQQQFNDWLNDLPNRIADRYGAPRSYASQVMSYTASDLSHFNDPTSSSTTNPRGNNPTPSNKNPSYSERQSQADLSKTRAQRWSQDQQQQQSWDAQRSGASNSTSSLTTTSPSGFWQGVNDIDEMDAGTQLGLEAAVTGATLPDNASTAEIAGFYVGETLGAAAMVMSGEALIPMGQEAVGLAATVYSSLSQFWGRAEEVSENVWQMTEEAMQSMSDFQIQNLERFISKIPQNSESIRIKYFLDNSMVFQADSPAANISGSFAQYEKQIDSAGKTILYTKTTFGADGGIIHIAPKFPNGPKIYPELDLYPKIEFTP